MKCSESVIYRDKVEQWLPGVETAQNRINCKLLLLLMEVLKPNVGDGYNLVNILKTI